MTRTWMFKCNGCGTTTEQDHADGWHEFNFSDGFGAPHSVSVCPDCWPVKPLAVLLGEVAEEVRNFPWPPAGLTLPHA